MRRQLSNSMYGVLDYIAYPAGMLIVAPIALRCLGVERFGIWMMASAAITTGAIIASGFGDANIRSVAMKRATGDHIQLVRVVRGAMGIHLLLGSAMAILGWCLAPIATMRLVSESSGLRPDCLWCLRIASVLMLLRALETVCVSTQRAFERYGAAVRISLAARMLSLCAAATLPLFTHRVISILIATALFTSAGVIIQLLEICALLGTANLLPSFDGQTARALLGFGMAAWVQAVCGLVFSQVDRLVAGLSFGAAAVSAYAICVQMSQPIYGIAAGGLHFLFPRLTAAHATGNSQRVRRTVMIGAGVNLAFVAAGVSVLLLAGPSILRAWGGERMALASAAWLPMIAWSTALSGLGIAGNYSMLALGRIRIVTALNLAGGLLMTALMFWLVPRSGLRGLAGARLAYGPVTLLVYIPLIRQLFRRDAQLPTSDSSFAPSAPPSPPIPVRTRANVLGIAIDALDIEGALAAIAKSLDSGEKGYVCATGVHGVMEALRDDAVAHAFRDAAVVVPDGTPMVWVGRWQGHSAMRHVTGPTLMQEVFQRKEFTGYSHFFYGGKEGIAGELAAAMRQRHPHARIAGVYTPPFRPLTISEEQALVNTIRDCKPDIIWVGISTPRQELFMRRMLPHLDTRLMFGVGAAFDFHTGRIRDCAPWIKNCGLHWLHRLLQDPKRLWRRNVGNAAFLWHILLQLSGLKGYKLQRDSLARDSAAPASSEIILEYRGVLDYRDVVEEPQIQ